MAATGWASARCRGTGASSGMTSRPAGRDPHARLRRRRASGGPGATGRPVDHAGPFYAFTGYEPRTEGLAPAPPIYLAVTRPRMAEVAGEVADGVLCNLINSDAWMRGRLLPRIRVGLERAHRARADLDVGMLRFCSIDDDRGVARDLRPALAFYFTVPYFAEMLEFDGMHEELAAGLAAARAGDPAAMAAAVSDRMIATFALAGTANDVRTQLRSYAGPFDWVLLCPPVTDDPGVTVTMARRLVATFGDWT